MRMADSTTPDQIPADIDVVAGYGDGAYMWSTADWDRFPNSKHLVIVVLAAHVGDILDVETGDATPADVPGWIDRFNRAGRQRATIYCNRSTIDAVRQAAAGRPFDWWAATLDGTQSVPDAVAVQFIDHGAWDESVIISPEWVQGGANVVTDTVVPSSPVSGKIWRNAQWYNWTDLAPLQTTDQTNSTGSACTWTEAKLVDGVWYDRVGGGDWALKDADIDDGGFDPTHFRPAPVPPPPQPPPPPPPSSELEARVTALESWRKSIHDAS